MGSASRKLKRHKNNHKNKQYFLSLEERACLENKIKDIVKEKVYENTYDTIAVMADMLVNDFGKLMKKDTRLKVFGELIKEKLPSQLRNHSLDKHQLLVEAGIGARL